MKWTSDALLTLINQARGNPDARIYFADCFTFVLSTGVVLAYTNLDQNVIFNNYTFYANGPLVQGFKYKAAIGLEVDKQQITLAARPSDLLSGAQFLAAVRDGAFDGATVKRDRVFMTAPGGPVVGGVQLFLGRVSTIDQCGRTSAKITVASDLVVLDYDMPRNLFSPTCLHVLYDSGCMAVKANFATNGTVGAGSTASLINFAGALARHAQGAIDFLTGANASVAATVKSAVAGTSLTLMYPLPNAPATGDSFTVYAGCDHTRATCQNVFNNLINHRGFPFVPPPQIAF